MLFLKLFVIGLYQISCDHGYSSLIVLHSHCYCFWKHGGTCLFHYLFAMTTYVFCLTFLHTVKFERHMIFYFSRFFGILIRIARYSTPKTGCCFNRDLITALKQRQQVSAAKWQTIIINLCQISISLNVHE